jgi:Carbohydrate binding module (family 6).
MDELYYTVSVPADGEYAVYAAYRSEGDSRLSVVSDSGAETGTARLPRSGRWTEGTVGKLVLSAGACVLRLQIGQAGDGLEIRKIIVKRNKGI